MTLLYVFPQATQASGVRRKDLGRLTEADAQAILKDAASVVAVAPFSSLTMQVVAGDKNVATQVMGTTRAYWEVRAFTFAT